MKTEIRYGKRIKEERQKRGWTQEHLAEVAGIAARTVARVEKGEVQGLESLMAIGAAFGMELRELAQTFRIAEAKPLRSLVIRRAEDLRVKDGRLDTAYCSALQGHVVVKSLEHVVNQSLKIGRVGRRKILWGCDDHDVPGVLPLIVAPANVGVALGAIDCGMDELTVIVPPDVVTVVETVAVLVAAIVIVPVALFTAVTKLELDAPQPPTMFAHGI